jgi:hypothetical protein
MQQGGLGGTGRRSLVLIVLAAIAAIASWSQLGERAERRGAGPAQAQTQASSTVGFTSARHLDEHYEKHGAEFGRISKQEYLALAQALRDAPVGGPILEARRSDGVTTRFDRDNGAFIAFNRDRTIRTFFRPNDGERYFRRQAERGSE